MVGLDYGEVSIKMLLLIKLNCLVLLCFILILKTVSLTIVI